MSLASGYKTRAVPSAPPIHLVTRAQKFAGGAAVYRIRLLFANNKSRLRKFLTCGLHLWQFRFTGLTTYHGSPRRLVRR